MRQGSRRKSKPGMAVRSEVLAKLSLGTPSALSSGLSLRRHSSASGGTSCSFRNPTACYCTCMTVIPHSFPTGLFFDMPLCCALGRELPMTDRTSGGLNIITIAVFLNLVTSQGPSVDPWASTANVTHQLLQLLWCRMVCFVWGDRFSNNTATTAGATAGLVSEAKQVRNC